MLYSLFENGKKKSSWKKSGFDFHWEQKKIRYEYVALKCLRKLIMLIQCWALVFMSLRRTENPGSRFLLTIFENQIANELLFNSRWALFSSDLHFFLKAKFSSFFWIAHVFLCIKCYLLTLFLNDKLFTYRPQLIVVHQYLQILL